MSLAVAGVAKSFGDVPALRGVDLEVSEGELMVVVGPSGSGKTTLLRCVAGLEWPDEGRIEVLGNDITESSPGDRDVAMVFQEYALYPHLTVAGNIGFGLKARKVDKSAIENKVRDVAELVGLAGVLGRLPSELSGGEKQRVALARAIVRQPSLFLMDEPLANLDAELRAHTRTEIKRLQKRLGTTTLYVTHDQVEAMTIGDRVTVLRAGVVEQIASPVELYRHPANAFVARFIGSPPMNVFPTDVLPGDRRASHMGVRPEDLRLVTANEGRVSGVIEFVEVIGGEVLVHVDVSGSRVVVRVPGHEHPVTDGHVGLLFIDDDIHWFEGPDGKAVR